MEYMLMLVLMIFLSILTMIIVSFGIFGYYYILDRIAKKESERLWGKE